MSDNIFLNAKNLNIKPTLMVCLEWHICDDNEKVLCSFETFKAAHDFLDIINRFKMLYSPYNLERDILLSEADTLCDLIEGVPEDNDTARYEIKTRIAEINNELKHL